MNFEDYLNEEVTLFGIAENSIYGAIVMCGPRSLVYVDGLQEWGEVEDKTVKITGIVVAEGDDGDLRTEEGVKHGVGRRYILKDATWKRLN
ncbi:MAG: hypothetical protein JWN03_1072 [Nocardia sp.]|uniref:hypothetical protein n=1 Tax=Nocardia sp. TaxID=1821 RepID=UPI00262A5A4F|nr:hypothetical protein [Nocardia sp.]MCU1640797.1 hypothetical protein [Nocardia sp.]